MSTQCKVLRPFGDITSEMVGNTITVTDPNRVRLLVQSNYVERVGGDMASRPSFPDSDKCRVLRPFGDIGRERVGDILTVAPSRIAMLVNAHYVEWLPKTAVATEDEAAVEKPKAKPAPAKRKPRRRKPAARK